MLNKREIVKNILELKETPHIPVILNCFTFSVANYGYKMSEVLNNPEKWAESIMVTREKIGSDGLCGGLYNGFMASIAGHLKNSDGITSETGEDTIHSLKDLDKLRSYNPETCINLNNILKTIELMRKEQPDEPIYVIIRNPAHTAFYLMGGKNAFRCMAKEPELFIKLSDTLEDILFSGVLKLIDAGVDFLWSPMPNFSGYCISRKTYEKCCWRSNIKYNKRIHDAGAKLVIHTCGKYDDRFDLVLEEYGDGWHISDTVTRKIKEKYGDKVALMGNIPCSSVLMEGTPEEVYKVAYEDCISGGKNGGFILSGDCDLSPLTPMENIKQVVKAAKDAEKVFYNKY
ncbi:hypothetical protein E9840_08485 [Tissierella creatinini]|nr:hypothetical protein E9840_08485 [Tissierella creatinini]TJX64604.1 hypothetical protein E8P77_11680 [Soehngenia saccharolytica]